MGNTYNKYCKKSKSFYKCRYCNKRNCENQLTCE